MSIREEEKVCNPFSLPETLLRSANCLTLFRYFVDSIFCRRVRRAPPGENAMCLLIGNSAGFFRNFELRYLFIQYFGYRFRAGSFSKR